MSDAQFILASGSPQRRKLLTDAGYVFDVVPANIDESIVPVGLSPKNVAQHLAVAKARVVAYDFPDLTVLAADTVVALGDLMLGKPTDADDARRMLTMLSGTTQQVYTGVMVMRRSFGGGLGRTVSSTVSMRSLSPEEIDAYVASKQWEGKAGGYGIQDNDPFVTRMTGSLTNIIGLPMDDTAKMLAEMGIYPLFGPDA